MSQDDDRQYAPATRRNREPILGILRSTLPGSGLVLELASGTGEHIVHFARALPMLTWQPSDPSEGARRSIAAWIAAEGLNNLCPPLDLDAMSDSWPLDHAAALVCINMIHISPWAATEGLMAGASRILDEGAPLYLYGPFRQAGRPIEPSNAAFDTDLRQRDPRWGLRELAEVTACAAMHGLRLDRVVDMPANNLSVVFRKTLRLS
jgi:SAM-dependent methyltransferase